ncbi:hypothetical protein D3C79_757000 [compost metagenome]
MDQTIQAFGNGLEIRIDHLDPVDFSHYLWPLAHGADGDGAVFTDLDLLLWRHGNRPAVTHDRHAVGGTQHTQGIDIHARGTHIGFAAIRCLHGDKAVTTNGHIQVTPGFQHRARRKIRRRAFGHGVGTRRKAVTKHRHRARLLQVTLKTGSGNVRQVVGMRLLRQRVLAGTGHGHVQHLVHSISPLRWRTLAARRCFAVLEASFKPTLQKWPKAPPDKGLIAALACSREKRRRNYGASLPLAASLSSRGTPRC